MTRNKAYREAEKKIAEAMRTGATELNLSSYLGAEDAEKLTELPQSMGRLTQIEWLNLQHNQLTALPKWLGQLTHLQSLDLSGNQLRALPESLGQLTHLQSLSLRDNQLTTLPESMGRLTQIEWLNLENNQLTALPKWLGRLRQLQSLSLAENQLTALPKSLSQLTQLRMLDLWGNELTALPTSLGELDQLEELNLSDNQLTVLPDSLGELSRLVKLIIGCREFDIIGPARLSCGADIEYGNPLQSFPGFIKQLKKLELLAVAKCQLHALPESLGQLTQLQSLDLSHNKLTALPETMGRLTRLQRLNLVGNQLRALPDSLGNCERLKSLFLHGNEALGIPPEVLGPEWPEAKPLGSKDPADPRAILEWYFQSRAEAARRLNEAKMLLVGQGGVGKTSLVHYLIHNKPCDPDELPTEGINIDEWDVQGKMGADGTFERIDLHLWDFGGQEIMHATRQFFLTRRSLYLLVIDARAGEKESNIHYWLKIIQSYGGDSPVLVVVNKCDLHPHELNETRLMRDYPNIRGFVQTSCTTGRGMAELRREIGKLVRRLPHVFDELPGSYFAVKENLEETAQKRNYIPIEDYRGICRDHEVAKRESQDRLIRFLHDLGVVLNFQDPDDPYGQNDPFVLNPEWVTGGVYAILNDRELKEKRDGLLNRQKLEAVLGGLEGYPKKRHGFIVRKMMQFELAYQIDHGRKTRWLVSELLDPKEPNDLDWKPEKSLNFQYDYRVLPAGVICRFIVRMHRHVDRKRSWRSGTVLTMEDNTVLVRGDTENNRAFIAVQGPVGRRKEKLAIVRDAFRYVHSTIPALRPAEQVPLPDKPEVAVPYDHLLKLEELGESNHFPVNADRSYSVAELLNGVDSTRYRNQRRRRVQRERREMDGKHVFVSYCHDNREEVARLVRDLEDAGEPVWWDEDIPGGRDWKEAIREAMDNAYAVVVCLSPELTEERHRSGVHPELRDAIATFRQYGPDHAYIFPVRLAECEVPPIEIDDVRTMERLQHIDLFPEPHRAAGLEKLLESLSAAPEHP